MSVSLGNRSLLALHGGSSTKEPATPVDSSTLFRVASVSKVFPALLAHLFADDGRLGLDDPVAAHLPGFVRPRSPFPGDVGEPTLRHLMSHTAGLQREAPPGNVTSDVLALVAASLLIAPPGGAPPSYSNLGFALLGYAVESAAGAHTDDEKDTVIEVPGSFSAREAPLVLLPQFRGVDGVPPIM